MKMMGEVVCRGLDGFAMGGCVDEWLEGLKWMGKWIDRKEGRESIVLLHK